MKKIIRVIAMVLIAASLFCVLTGCAKKSADTADTAAVSEMYSKDTELGEGKKTVIVNVETPDGTVKFTVRTDRDILGDALLDNGLIDGDEGEYGLYVKIVNGITADYDTDKSYWAFYINGEFAMTGVDTTEIDENAEYLLKYTKE